MVQDGFAAGGFPGPSPDKPPSLLTGDALIQKNTSTYGTSTGVYISEVIAFPPGKPF